MGPATKGDLRIWHNSRFGDKAFVFMVQDVQEAKKLLRLLAAYDLYQGDRVVSNAQGLTEFDGQEWLEWDDKEGNQIDDVEEVGHG